MHKETSNIDYSALLKYFQDRTTDKEAERVVQWLGDVERDYNREKKLHLLWDEVEPENQVKEKELERLLDTIHHQIQLRAKKNTKQRLIQTGQKTKVNFNRGIKNLSRIAAIFLLPVMIYIGYEILNQKMWLKNQSDIVYNEIITPLGAQSRFELPDGTKGVLNNGSILKFPVKFTGDIREVKLQGEAFFDVEHNSKRPFIIRTNGLDVKVLGTRLNVYSYPEEAYQEVTLEEGTVELVEKTNDVEHTVVLMEPGQHVVYKYDDSESLGIPGEQDKQLVVDDKTGRERMTNNPKTRLNTEEGELYLQKADAENYTGWTEGRLILRNDPMPVILRRMERWYNVKFNITDERVNDYTYWATFKEENLDQVLRLLSLTGPVKFTKLPRLQSEDGTFLIQEVDVSIK